MAGQAFDAPRLQAFYLDPDEVVIIGLDTKDGKEHPLYDERISIPVLQADIDNVLKHGVLEPGLVRKERLPNDEWRTIVLDGRQRTKWARAANAVLRKEYDGAELERRLIRVPFIPKQVGDAAKQMGMMTAANVRKESDFVTKAEQARRMLDRGIALGDIAVDFGVTEGAVNQWLRLLDLSTTMRGAVEAGVLTPSAAVQHSDLPHEEQDRIIAEAQKLGVKISTTEARDQRSKRKRTNGSAGKDVVRPVGVGILRKLLTHEEFMGGLEPSERSLIQWICGEQGMSRRVKGLMGALRDVGYLDKE